MEPSAPRRRRARAGAHPLAALLALVLAAAPAAAQEVVGTLRSESPRLPIAGARLYLASPSGAVVDTAFSGPQGNFRLVAAAAGEYVVHFHMDGYAGYTSEPVRLAAGAATRLELDVPLVSTDAMRRIGAMIETDDRLQSSLPEICGEELRLWESGLLVGTVRTRGDQQPVAGARVTVLLDGRGTSRSTLASEHGIFVLCNVPVGERVEVLAETPGAAPQTTVVEIRAGMVAWYDVWVGPERR